MTVKTYDAAVVEASVALIERHSDPNAYKALCTHFIHPWAVPTI